MNVDEKTDVELNVYLKTTTGTENLQWKLIGYQGTAWKKATVPLFNFDNKPYQVQSFMSLIVSIIITLRHRNYNN